MLQIPVKVVQTFRPRIPAGLLAATAVSTIVFAATPFLIPAIADDRGVSVGTVAVISTTQLGGFVFASWLAPRLFPPRRRMMVVAIVIGVVSNLLSGVWQRFDVLVAMRFWSGASLGLIAWISWTEVFGDDERVGDIAVIGPIVGTVSSPLLALLLDAAGPNWLYIALAATYALPAAFTRSMRLDAPKRAHVERHRPTRAAVVILVSLWFLTFGGSMMFVFAGAIGRDLVGLSPVAMSWVFAANALAGVPSARYRGGRPLPGVWMVVTAVCAATMGWNHSLATYLVIMPVWGFAFWMGIPGAFSLLAERSAYPQERAGDAQSVMAFGRVFGPLIGGAIYDASPRVLGTCAGGLMLTGSLLLLWVEWRIRPDAMPAVLLMRRA